MRHVWQGGECILHKKAIIFIYIYYKHLNLQYDIITQTWYHKVLKHWTLLPTNTRPWWYHISYCIRPHLQTGILGQRWIHHPISLHEALL